LMKYSVYMKPEGLEEIHNLSPFSLRKDLKELSDAVIYDIGEEIANELLLGINRPPNAILGHLSARKNAAWVKIKTMDIERDAGKSNGYRCIVLVDTVNHYAFLLHIYRHSHGEDLNISKKEKNQLKKLVEEYAGSMD